MYTLSYNGIEGQAGLYARIQRLLDGLWWDESVLAWVVADAYTIDGDIVMTETAESPGEYTAQAAFNPAKGGVYVVSVYTDGGVLLMRTDCPYLPNQRTVLQIINNVQKELRLPQTGEIAFSTSAHAQLLLSFLNKTMDLIMEHSPSSALSVSGAFQLTQGLQYFPVSPVNISSGIDTLSRLQIGSNEPLMLVTAEQLADYRRTFTQQGQPLYYRLYNRRGGSMIIEVAPTPDATYTVDFSGLLRVAQLANHDDVPMLDADTVQLGVLWMAKQDQGEEYQTDLAAFQAKISLHNPDGGAAGDVDFL